MKKILISLLIVISVVCIGLDCWFGYLHFFGKEKQTDQTFYISDMKVSGAATGEASEETKVFCEVQVFKNGIEFKFNYFTDENISTFYSSGIQLLLKDENKTIKDNDIFSGTYSKTLATDKVKDREIYTGKSEDVYSFLFMKGKLYQTEIHEILTNKVFDNFEFYEYSSFDNFETTTNSKYLQDGDEFFQITLSDKIYGLSFKDYDKIIGSEHIDNSKLTEVGHNQQTIETSPKWNVVEHEVIDTYYYRALDLSYFIESIGNAVLSLPAGTDKDIYYNVPNILNFYNYENGSYELINNTSDESLNLYANFSNYMKIKVKINETNIENSKQSLFNTYAGNMNYGINNESSIIDYETGRFLVNVNNINNLELVTTEESGVYKFKLSESFINKYSCFKSVYLNITIDLDELNIEFGGFELPNNTNFTIYKLTDNNGKNLLISEVQYA